MISETPPEIAAARNDVTVALNGSMDLSNSVGNTVDLMIEWMVRADVSLVRIFVSFTPKPR